MANDDFSDLLGDAPAKPRRKGRGGDGAELVKYNAARRAAGLPVGRPKGVPNKLTALVREGIEAAYNACGGHDGFCAWANAHKAKFYELMLKSIPREREANNLGSGITINVRSSKDFDIQRTPIDAQFTEVP